MAGGVFPTMALITAPEAQKSSVKAQQSRGAARERSGGTGAASSTRRGGSPSVSIRAPSLPRLGGAAETRVTGTDVEEQRSEAKHQSFII